MSGLWRELYLTTDTVYQELEYKKGVKNGVFKEYYINGKISMQGNYLSGLKNGEWTYSFINGALDMKGTFKEDKQNGFWTFYYPKGITTDGTNLYVADQFNHRIRKIVISTGAVTTLAGSGAQGSANATGTSATFKTNS